MKTVDDQTDPEITEVKRKKFLRTTVDGSGFSRGMVSFRSDLMVMDDFKKIAAGKGIPYQALMRRVLKDFVGAEHSKNNSPV